MGLGARFMGSRKRVDLSVLVDVQKSSMILMVVAGIAIGNGIGNGIAIGIGTRSKSRRPCGA